MELIKKVYGGRVCYIDETGKAHQKECYKCKELKDGSEFNDGKGLGKLENKCKACQVKHAFENTHVRLKDLDIIEQVLKEDPTLRFAPKYDKNGRRWLFFYERDEFRELALKEGWKVARAKFEINNFVYIRLREELFTKEEIAAITKKTEPTRKKKSPFKSYELTIIDRDYRNKTYFTIMEDQNGKKYEITNGRFYYKTENAKKVTFEAKKKGVIQRHGEKFTQLYYARNIKLIS